jgi:hypothetical protein
VDVRENEHKLLEMLKASSGKRRVPVIVEGEDVIIGYGGT